VCYIQQYNMEDAIATKLRFLDAILDTKDEVLGII
jgi:hypothetical protein